MPQRTAELHKRLLPCCQCFICVVMCNDWSSDPYICLSNACCSSAQQGTWQGSALPMPFAYHPPGACRYNVMRMTVNWHKGFTSCCASFVAPTANLLRLPKLSFQDVSVLDLRFCTGGLYSARVNMPAAGMSLRTSSPCLLHQYPSKNPFFPRADA